MGSGAWALGLFVSQFLGPRAHPLVWYFFSLVLVVSLVVISLVVISFVVSCLRTVPTSTCNTSREASPKQRACTPARRARRERSGKQAARVHATASRPTSVLASSTQANVQATLHMYVCVQVCSTCSSALSKCRASRPYVAECTRKHDAWRRGPARDRAASSRPGDGQRDRRRSAHRLWEIGNNPNQESGDREKIARR